MSTSRISLSLDDIDAKIAELRRQANDILGQANKLEQLKDLAVQLGTPIESSDHGSVSTVNLPPRFRLRSLTTPAERPPNRKAQIARFLVAYGPHERSKIIENMGIPEGTVNSEMRDRTIFCEVPGTTKWDVTPEARAKYQVSNEIEDFEAEGKLKTE